MTERMAPGHVYQPSLGTGIEWKHGLVRLWEGGRVVEKASQTYPDPYTYWAALAFAESFPAVTHWWFRSAWTQRVRLSRPQGLDAGAVWGYMQFIDDSAPGQVWTAEGDDLPVIATPYPPNETQPVNLPLRLALARLVVGVITGAVEADQWIVVTSLVARDELRLAFPDQVTALPFRLEGLDQLDDLSLRQALCSLQGLKRGG